MSTRRIWPEPRPTAPDRHQIHAERCQAALATITEALPGFLGASSDATWGDVTSANDLAV